MTPRTASPSVSRRSRPLRHAAWPTLLLVGLVAPAAPAWGGSGLDDQLVLSGQHSTLTGTNGGEGGSLSYLHQLTPAWVLDVGGEYQKLATSHWAFGSLSTAYSHALSAHTRWNVHAEGHEGRGHTGAHRFDYSIVAAGLGLTLGDGLATDLEDRYIAVDTSRGSLPKLTLSKPWGSRWQTSISYARSYGGNLDTQYGLVRVDFYGPGFDLLGGGSLGRASPAVLNINGVLQSRARHLTEEFFGVTLPIARTALTVLADELDLAGSRRFTVTLNLAVKL